MKLLGKLICLIRRQHKRGKLVRIEGGGGTGLPAVRVTACPRCGKEARRKADALREEPTA